MAQLLKGDVLISCPLQNSSEKLIVPDHTASYTASVKRSLTPRLSARWPLTFGQGTSPHHRCTSSRLLAGDAQACGRSLAPSTSHSPRRIFSSRHTRHTLICV